MRPQIVRVINGVHMALGHDGLLLLVKKEAGIDLRTLDASKMVVCINADNDKLKAIGGGGIVLGYIKMPKGRKLMREAIQFLPRVFGGEGFTYDDAVRRAIEESAWNRKIALPPVQAKQFVTTFVKEATHV